MRDTRGVNQKTRTALNMLAICAIEAAQAVNASPKRIDAAALKKALAAIDARIHEARKEIDV